MNKAKRFIKTSGVYFIGSILSKLIAFFLLPLYTQKLSPDLFGMYDIIITIMSLAVPVVFFQIWDGMFRFALEKQQETEKYSIISNSFSIWALGFVIYTIVFWTMSRIFHFELTGLIFAYGLSVALQYLYTFIARVFLNNKLFVLSGLVNSLLSAIINIVLILQFRMGIESLYIAPVIGCAAQILMIEAVLRPLKHFHSKDVKIEQIREMLRFSIPLCIATVSYWLLSGYTKIAISQQLGTYENGLYAVANKFSSLIVLIVSVFQYAWNELAYLIASDDNRVASYEKSIQYIFKVAVLGSGIFMLFTKIIFPYFIDPSYNGALMIIPLSLIGVAANSLAGFIGTIFMAEKQTKYILWTTIISVVFNILFTWIFTPIWGLQGAIGALCLAFSLLAIFRIYVVRKLFAIILPWSYSIYLFVLAASTYVFFTVNNIWILVIIIVLLIGISLYSLRDILLALWKNITKKESGKLL